MILVFSFSIQAQQTNLTKNFGIGSQGATPAFGGELVFSLGGIPLGLNISIGQGIGRDITPTQSMGIAGVYVGAGIHAYF